MLYPVTDLDTWLKKYPELHVKSSNCPGCGRKIVTDVPFFSKEWAGLKASECKCGVKYPTAVFVARHPTDFTNDVEILLKFSDKKPIRELVGENNKKEGEENYDQ